MSVTVRGGEGRVMARGEGDSEGRGERGTVRGADHGEGEGEEWSSKKE